MADKETKVKQKKHRPLSLIVFLITLVVVLITLTSVVFPAFVLGSISGIKYPVEINIFETGIWIYPFLVTNLLVFGASIMHFKKKIPQLITNPIKFVLHFEVSKEIAFLVITILLGFYITFSVSELSSKDPWEDYERYVKPSLEKWTFSTIIENVSEPHLVFILGIISMKVFGNYAVIAFIASIALLLLTYFITAKIANKRLAGIVAMVIVLQSGNFLIYDTTITYPNFWILFYLLSLYTIHKQWPLSSISYILSITSKALTAPFLPMTIFFLYEAGISKKKKIYILVSYATVVTLLVVTAFFIADVSVVKRIKFNPHEFWAGFAAFSFESRYDGLIVMFLLPLTIALFIASRNGVAHANSIMVLIMGILLLAAILPGFTDFDNNPYRYMPLVIFFAIGVGILLSKRTKLA